VIARISRISSGSTSRVPLGVGMIGSGMFVQAERIGPSMLFRLAA
jgi:hypothetical protein